MSVGKVRSTQKGVEKVWSTLTIVENMVTHASVGKMKLTQMSVLRTTKINIDES